MRWNRAKVGLQRAWTALLDLIYPRECMACGVRLSAAEGACLCEECVGTMPRIGADQCPRCGDALGPHAAGPEACPSCPRLSAVFFSGTCAVHEYEGAARELVHGLKYGRDLRAAPLMAGEMARKLADMDWFGSVDVVVPVPLHWRRRVARRFNQSALLARGVAQQCRVRLGRGMLRRTRMTKAQWALTHAEREENVRGAFVVARPERVRGKVLLLVDDVMTTCATAVECSRVLKQAGARKVYVAVFAR